MEAALAEQETRDVRAQLQEQAAAAQQSRDALAACEATALKLRTLLQNSERRVTQAESALGEVRQQQDKQAGDTQARIDALQAELSKAKTGAQEKTAQVGGMMILIRANHDLRLLQAQ